MPATGGGKLFFLLLLLLPAAAHVLARALAGVASCRRCNGVTTTIAFFGLARGWEENVPSMRETLVRGREGFFFILHFPPAFFRPRVHYLLYYVQLARAWICIIGCMVLYMHLYTERERPSYLEFISPVNQCDLVRTRECIPLLLPSLSPSH